MGIEQVQPKNLSDVWNPMQYAGPMLQLQQSSQLGQHYAAQAVTQEQRAMEQARHDKTMEQIGAIKEIYPHASSASKYELMQRWGSLAGFPPAMLPDKNAFYANPSVVEGDLLSLQRAGE